MRRSDGRTPPYATKAYLVELAGEYADLVRLSEDVSLEGDERRTVLAQRSLTHDALIAVFVQFGIPFVDRDDVRRQALAIARRGTMSG